MYTRTRVRVYHSYTYHSDKLLIHSFCGSSNMASSVSSECNVSRASAAQPATSCRSADQRAISSRLKLSSIREVRRWLAEEPIASCSSTGIQRLREAVAVLSQPKPRKQDVRPLQSKWQVAFRKNKNPRPLGDVLEEFQDKVIEAAQELQDEEHRRTLLSLCMVCSSRTFPNHLEPHRLAPFLCH